MAIRAVIEVCSMDISPKEAKKMFTGITAFGDVYILGEYHDIEKAAEDFFAGPLSYIEEEDGYYTAHEIRLRIFRDLEDDFIIYKGVDTENGPQ